MTTDEEIAKWADEYAEGCDEKVTFDDDWWKHFAAGFRKAQELYEQKLKEQLQRINEMYCSK